MTDFADDSNISLNAFDEQNADKNALNGKNGMTFVCHLIFCLNFNCILFFSSINRK